MDKRTGKNKYGIKLEDHVDYDSYRRAILNARVKACHSTEKGKLAKYKANAKYLKSEKGKLANYKRCKKYASGKGKTLINALHAKRRSAKLQRTPKWVDLEAIKKFYDNCPKGYAVDHIVPLQGVNISGLHVLNNLQYLTKSENSKKGNRYAV